MFFDERRNKVIPVVVVDLPTQFQGLLRFLAGCFERLRKQLIRQKFVVQTLINQDAAWKWRVSLSHQCTGIVLLPVLLVAAQIRSKCLNAPRAKARCANRRKCRYCLKKSWV